MTKVRWLLLVCMLSIGMSANGEDKSLVIIASKDNVAQIKIEDVTRIFLGKITEFPDGKKAVPLDINPEDPDYEEFARVVLKKTPSQLRAYWAKQIFTGKGRPPMVIASSEDLQKLVITDPKYLSYVDRNDITHKVRWVLEVKTD